MFNLSVYVFLLLLVFIIMYDTSRCSVSDCVMHFVVTVKIYKWLSAAYRKWAPMETDQSAVRKMLF